MIKTTVGIDGMMCTMCEAHINNTIRDSLPVKKVKSSHRKKTAVITSENELDEDALRDAVNKTGYTVTSISVNK